MAQAITDLEPKRLWYYFNEICKIPHGSGNEAGLRDYIINFAKENNLEYRVDEKGNFVVRKNAVSSNSKEAVIIQAHVDMVCECDPKNPCDMDKEPVKPYIDEEWVKAKGTSLGADNGIAIATALAILESNDYTHSPLECLFTVEEEIGLYGAQALDPSLISGKTLINMDSEEDWLIFAGCAGGKFFNLKIPYKRTDVPEGYSGLELSLTDFRGGHSGLVIHEERGNPLKQAARILAILRRNYDLIVSSFKGGTKHNVIPCEAHAQFVVKTADLDEVKQMIGEIKGHIKDELKNVDPDLKIVVKDAKLNDVVDKEASDKMIRFVDVADHGVLTMSKDIKDLVQSSINCAIVRTEDNHFYLESSIRSSVATEMEAIKSSYFSLAEALGLEAVEFGGYPGWEPNMDSKILGVAKNVYKELFNEDPEVTAVHAGLECGIIGEKIPGIDMVSYGPWMEQVHSINERVNIKSVAKYWKYTIKLLEEQSKS